MMTAQATASVKGPRCGCQRSEFNIRTRLRRIAARVPGVAAAMATPSPHRDRGIGAVACVVIELAPVSRPQNTRNHLQDLGGHPKSGH